MPTSSRARGAEASFSEVLQLAFFSFSFVFCLVSLIHRVLHTEASQPALQFRVPSEKLWVESLTFSVEPDSWVPRIMEHTSCREPVQRPCTLHPGLEFPAQKCCAWCFGLAYLFLCLIVLRCIYLHWISVYFAYQLLRDVEVSNYNLQFYQCFALCSL